MRAPRRRTARPRALTAALALPVALSVALSMAACASSSKPSASATSEGSGSPTSTAAASPSTTPTPSVTASPSGSAVPTSLDPCALVTTSEANALTGQSYGAGKHESTNGGKECIYGSQTRDVFQVLVGQADSTADAQRAYSQAEGQADELLARKLPAGVHVDLQKTDVTGVGDRAATLYGAIVLSGVHAGFVGIYMLSGATFVAITDLVVGGKVPSRQDMINQGQTTIGRV